MFILWSRVIHALCMGQCLYATRHGNRSCWDLRDYLYASNVVIFINMYLTLVILLFIRTYQSQTLVKVLWLDLGTTRQVLSRALIFTIYSSLLLIGGRASGSEKLSPVFASLRGRGRIQRGGTHLRILSSTDRFCVGRDSYASATNQREIREKEEWDKKLKNVCSKSTNIKNSNLPLLPAHFLSASAPRSAVVLLEELFEPKQFTNEEPWWWRLCVSS